jgi:hypothetical protein
MKTKLFYLIFLVIFSSCSNRLSKEQSTQLWRLYKEQNYFKLDNFISKIKFSKDNADLVLFKAKLDYVFNNPIESNELISLLLDKFPKHFNDSIISDLLQMRSTNAMRLQDYKNAYKDDSLVIAQYSHVCDSSVIESLKNDILIYTGLMDEPKMEVIRSMDSKLPLKRDKAGLFNIPVIINKDTVDFVFDTGANMSCIDKTHATKYGVKIIGNNVSLGGSLGKQIKTEIGIINIKLGNIVLENCVLLVLPDSSLSFDKGKYNINGIIGFPIMYALHVFIVKDDKYLILPQKIDKSNVRNLAFDELYMVAMVNYKNDTLPFHFDTGANKTEMFSLFFKKYKNEIINSCKKKNVTTASVDGEIRSEVYILDSALISVGNSDCQIKSIRVTTKDFKGDDVKYFYGNLGQDYIKKFSEMKVNFTSMNLSFSNKKE